MNLSTGIFCFLFSGAILVLFSAEGQSTGELKKTPGVALTITRIRGWEYFARELEGEFKGKNVRFVILACDVVIDNQTGEDLIVLSSYFSAFDGLAVELLREGKKAGEQPYFRHQSPYSSEPRPFVLTKGKNQKDMRIPFRLPPNDWTGLQAKIVGDLPGSTFKGKLESNLMKIQRVTDLAPPAR